MKMKSFSNIVSSCVLTLALFHVTPVACQPGPGMLYPYVKPGTNIIVHLDEYGGISKDKLFSQRITTKNQMLTIHSSAQKRLPAQFEVKLEPGSYTSTTATQCPNLWRLPTYKEALVIVLLKDELNNFPLREGYWLTTTNIDFYSDESLRFIMFWSKEYGITSFVGNPVSYSYVQRICVRDIDTSSLGLSDL